jgi:hypothetical protein
MLDKRTAVLKKHGNDRPHGIFLASPTSFCKGFPCRFACYRVFS